MDRNLLLTSFLLLAGLFVGVLYGPSMVMDAVAVQSWEPTPAKLLDARASTEAKGGRGLRSSHFLIYLRYQYEFNGQAYEGTRYQISQPLTELSHTDAQIKVDQLMADPDITVYVNPDEPAEAVMDQGGGNYAWLVTLFGLAMALSGAFVYFTRVRVS